METNFAENLFQKVNTIENTTISLPNIEVEIDPSDPRYTFKDWDNFNGSDWIATRQDCHNFGNITVITHNSIPTLKLFIAKEIAEIFSYSEPGRLLDLINRNVAHGSKTTMVGSLNQVVDFTKVIDYSISNRGLSLINYAGFNYAIMHSTKPNARLVQKWVYGNLMPKVAETGSYISQEFLSKFDVLLDVVYKQSEELALLKPALIETQNSFNEKIEEQNKKLDQMERVLKKLTVPSDVSLNRFLDYFKDVYNLKTNSDAFLEFLKNIKMVKSNREPYIKYINDGYFQQSGSPFDEMGDRLIITQLGATYIINKLKELEYIS